MHSKNVIIAPSILAGDFSRLGEEAKRAEDAGADWLHVDIMDGHFVNNISMGPQAVAAINRSTKLFLDVHTMIYNPFEYIERFVEAGADRLTFHFEATEDVEETLEYIRKCSIKAGLAFRPETPVSFVDRYLDKCDLILLMTVNPGFGGQSFMPEVLEKISYVRQQCEQRQIFDGGVIEKNSEKAKHLNPFNIEVDGGINEHTAKQCIEAGANVLVAGTYLFGQPNMADGIKLLRSQA